MLGLCLLGPGAGSARAGFILVDGSALVFNNLDEPDRAMDVKIGEATIEDEDWLVVESVGDQIFVPSGFSAPAITSIHLPTRTRLFVSRPGSSR